MNVRAEWLRIGSLVVCLLLHGTNLIAGDRERIAARHEAMRNVTVLYHRLDTFNPPAAFVNRGSIPLPNSTSTLKVKTNPERYEAEFRYKDGQGYYSRARVDHPVVGEWQREMYAVSDGRVERLIQSVGGQLGNGLVTRDPKLPANEIIDCGLGLRALKGRAWLDGNAITQMELHGQENEGLVELVVSDNSGSKVEQRFTYDRGLGYSLLRIDVISRSRTYKTLVNSDFREVNDFQLPHTVEYDEWRWEGDVRSSSRRVLLAVDKYIVNDPENSARDFRLEWPVKTAVYDNDSGGQVTVKSRPQRLEDKVFIRAAMLQPRTSRWRPLFVCSTIISIAALATLAGLRWWRRTRLVSDAP